MAPLHLRPAAEANLEELLRLGGEHRPKVAAKEDGYDGPAGALAEWLGTGLQNPVHRFDSGRRLLSRPSDGSTAGESSRADSELALGTS